MKSEMCDAGELVFGSDAAVSVPAIAGSGGGDVGKRARVSSCGLEVGEVIKRAKRDFILPPGFLEPLPVTVLCPTPLSVRPIAPITTVNPMSPLFTSRPMAPLFTSRPMAPLSTVLPAMPLSTARPITSPSMVWPVESRSTSTFRLESPPLKLKKVEDKQEGSNGCRQFWKAGDYEGPTECSSSFSADIDHVRVHPKFLHSNATSHKWALGALAELLDNSMDEVCNGAKFVNIDVLKNPKDQTKMLLVEDNGGGMDPDKMRQCMSLGYSMKSKSANTIGQYGNGFKTSTMRLGADVIVFSRCQGKDGISPTQSIGMLSYTFLRNTGKQDIIVPMVDYEKRDDDWHQMERSSSVAWKTNMDSIVQWSPYSSEADLLQQFNFMFDQGTRIIIYNLWEDDEGQLELDFVTDAQDIQIRGANRDEKKIEMSKNFPNSRHFLTYHHSMRVYSPLIFTILWINSRLRMLVLKNFAFFVITVVFFFLFILQSYASILYLRLPQGFRIVLRGKEIEHHNITNDMMMKEEKIYRPQPGPDGVSKDPNIFAAVTIGFVKDAINHIDVQGFNVYHKNRLIKPFWRIWNAAGSDGRGVIGVLEANFIEPAHDKQGFERTAVLNRLEARLLRIQKNYWSSNCQKIGYAPRRQKKSIKNSEDNVSSPETPQQPCAPMMAKPSMVVQSHDSTRHQNSAKLSLHSNYVSRESGNSVNSDEMMKYEVVNSSKKPHNNDYEKSGECILLHQPRYHFSISSCNYSGSGQSNTECKPNKKSSDGSEDIACSSLLSSSVLNDGLRQSHKMGAECFVNGLKALDFGMHTKLLANHNKALKERIVTVEGKLLHDLKIAMQKNKELTEKVELLQKRLKDAEKEQETIVNIFLEERERRDAKDEKWRAMLKVANDKINKLENFAISGIKSELQ
ncbi:hypothetical protein IEQ34_010142 [Dendrobium chrysotoxum]|uniref:Morc S5 domain-containing protein n=1 Tax=Dendrobium chrysotoxum TaxID=161865 RepID=A0AAV7H109_DENCH|nr:hypothetical protein IEQ34_010142 [Dendrobium chrysotoxum]